MNILITGASRGIGRATALLLAQKGFQVMLSARNESDLKTITEEITKLGGKASYYVCDVSNEQQVVLMTQEIMQKFGKIDVLINNAGMGIFKAIENISLAEWEQVMDINVKGTFLCCKMVLPHMKSHHNGHIIVIASDVSKRTFSHGTLYCASKFAQDAFTAALRKEIRPFGIKVTTIYPGLTDTNFNGNTQGESRTKDWLKAEDVAQAIFYAISAPPQVVIDELMLHPKVQDY